MAYSQNIFNGVCHTLLFIAGFSAISKDLHKIVIVALLGLPTIKMIECYHLR